MSTEPVAGGVPSESTPAKLGQALQRLAMLAIAEKILLPLVIALMAFFGKQTSDRLAAVQIQVSKDAADAQKAIAQQQLRIAQAELERQRIEAQSNRELKYLELFYQDIESGELTKQQASVSLFYALEPRVAKAIATAVAANPGTRREIRSQISRLITDVDKFGPLINYSIVIYYEPSEATAARDLNVQLARLGFPNPIDLREEKPNFLNAGKYGYHIRYDDVYKVGAAPYMLNVLRACLPSVNFDQVIVTGDRTDGTFSVFLFRKTA